MPKGQIKGSADNNGPTPGGEKLPPDYSITKTNRLEALDKQ